MGKCKIAIALMFIILSGCKPSENLAEKFSEFSHSKEPEIDIDIQTPYSFIVDGQKTQVQGADKCYDKLSNTPYECIKLNKPFVIVYLPLPSGVQKEVWSVIRDGNKISLKRPNGSLVVPE